MTRRMSLVLAAALAAAADLPLKPDSVRFAVIGDMGTAGKEQYALARQMAAVHSRFPFSFVLTVGDNLYGGESAKDFERKFEIPYAPLLGAGVDFYASLGNHDRPDQRFYKPFHMQGKRYYSFKKGNAAFFALDSNYMDPEQLDWVKHELENSRAAWKICYFHHPLYSDGKNHGPDKDLRALLEPILEQTGVNVVFSGHEHIYERLKPHNAIAYFIVGNSGKLESHALRASQQTGKGFTSDRTFLVAQIAGDELQFQTISRAGEVVDSGVIERRRSR